jgi:ArsR family transcriptional regulator
MHQVLHYAPEPAPVVAEAARVLAPGGRLLIADFAPHDREELRTAHAHARLGFADDAMARWFEQAGLALVGDRRLDGGELTVRLWLGAKRMANNSDRRRGDASERKAA